LLVQGAAAKMRIIFDRDLEIEVKTSKNVLGVIGSEILSLYQI